MDPSERSAIIRKGRQLESEHLLHVKQAAIELDAATQWKKVLNRSERRDRDWILLALQSKKVPSALQWGSFDHNVSHAIKADREIFLHRLEMEDFQSYYSSSPYSKLPVTFRNNKEVMLKVVAKSSKSLNLASDDLKNDRDVVLAAIQGPSSIAPLAIQYASKKLQGDKRIVRAALSHEYGITAFSLLPQKLQRDYSLALWAIQSSSDECHDSVEFLEELSEICEEMLDDYEIVYETVKRRGSNLRFVTDESLLNDFDIVFAACEQDGAAIEYCPKGPTRDELLQESNLLVLLENGGHCVLKELGDEYMMQSKFLIPAVKNGMLLEADFASRLYQEDRPLFMDVLRHTNKPFVQYDMLPDDIRSDSSIGVAILKTSDFEEGSWAYRFAKEIPEDVVHNHIDDLMKLAAHESVPYSYGGSAGAGIWDEKSIVIELLKIDGNRFNRVSTRLKSDVDVVKAAVTTSISVSNIKQIPRAVFQDNHSLAASALDACDDRINNWNTRSDIYRHFGHQVASSRAVFLAWVQKGWPTKYTFGRNTPFSNDDTVALEAIKNADSENLGDVISEFSKSLLRKRTFMMSAAAVNCEVIKYASEDLLQDFDFLLKGVSVSRDALKRFTHKGSEFDHIADFAAEVRDRLNATDTFIVDFFGAISISSSGRKRGSNKRRKSGRGSGRKASAICHLPMLDLGYETGSVIKRMICEYADISIGPQIALLRKALDNLKFWGY